jgi:hypothetical protein
MDSPPTSTFRFWSRQREVLAAPPEWEPGFIELPIPSGAWEGALLLRQGHETEIYERHLGGTARAVADWPRSGAGFYGLRLELGDEVFEEIWRVSPAKLSAESVANMVSDLEARLPAGIALDLQNAGAFTGLRVIPPEETTLSAELVRIRRALLGAAGRPGVIDALGVIAGDPHEMLASSEAWVPAERARRVTPGGLMSAVSRGHNLSGPGALVKVPEVRVHPTVDVYENRLVKAFTRQIERRLRHLIPALGVTPAGEEAVTLLGRMAEARRRAAFLTEVQMPDYVPAKVTMVLLKRAEYRAVFEACLEFNRAVAVRLDEPALDAPVRNVPKLYELWGTLSAIAACLEAAVIEGYDVIEENLTVKRNGELFVRILEGGKPAVRLRRKKDGREATLVPQRSYAAGGKPLGSMSFAQIPDVALEVIDPESPRPRVYLFDPKYKLSSEDSETGEDSGKPKKTDIDAMHAYRDGIRDSDGERVVQYAAILYPGETKSYAPGLEALQATPGSSGALTASLQAVMAGAMH